MEMHILHIVHRNAGVCFYIALLYGRETHLSPEIWGKWDLLKGKLGLNEDHFSSLVLKTKSSIEDLFASTAVGNFQEHVATFGIKVGPPQDT